MLVLSAALFAVCLASASNALTSYRSRDGGPLALAKIYYKYGVPLPDDLAAAVSRLQHTKRATGSALATPEGQDLLYLVSVDIGTPHQRLNVDIDTGSGDFWVFSSLMLKNQVDGQAVYNPSNSTTASKLGDSTWEITYGDGSTSVGVVYVDQVTIGGLGVLSQAVEVATHVSEGFTGDSNNDGILGLALVNNHVRPTKQKTFFFGNLQPILDQPLFTVDLKKDAGKFARFASVTPAKTQLNPYSWPLQPRLHRFQRLQWEHHLRTSEQHSRALELDITRLRYRLWPLPEPEHFRGGKSTADPLCFLDHEYSLSLRVSEYSSRLHVRWIFLIRLRR